MSETSTESQLQATSPSAEETDFDSGTRLSGNPETEAERAASTGAEGQDGGLDFGSGIDPETEDLLEALRDVVDPELGVNVVDLGLIYGVTLEQDRTATIDMTLTSAACPLTDEIEDQARAALEGIVTDFRINWVWMPPWGPDKITEDGREQLRALGFNV
jgi:metal-sulfur cluster biosynthetic enzyme